MGQPLTITDSLLAVRNVYIRCLPMHSHKFHTYRLAGNTCICRNYILWFHAKISFFLSAELNFAFWTCAMLCTPTFSFGVSKEDDDLVILVSHERYLKRAIPRCASVHVNTWQLLLPSYYAYAYRMKIILCRIKLCVFGLNCKAQNLIPANTTSYTVRQQALL